jgi:hypothetical protein
MGRKRGGAEAEGAEAKAARKREKERQRQRRRKRKKSSRMRYQLRHPDEFLDSPGFLLLDTALPVFRLGIEVVPERQFCVCPATGAQTIDGIGMMKQALLRRLNYDVAFMTLDEWEEADDKEMFLRLAILTTKPVL